MSFASSRAGISYIIVQMKNEKETQNVEKAGEYKLIW